MSTVKLDDSDRAILEEIVKQLTTLSRLVELEG